MARVLYFAYGSNMLRERLVERCGSARYQGVAAVKGYGLCFAKRGRDLSGKATLVKSDAPSALVYGAAFTLEAAEIADLDRHEGLGRGYDREDSFPVELAHSGVTAAAMTYIAGAAHCDAALQPFDWYKALVIAGALQSGFSAEYIGLIRAFAHQPDLDVERLRRHEDILRRANFGDWQSLLKP